ncbi:MAG: uracil-DNA glycosylase family protein [Pseudomonadota bacterium]
MTAPASPPSVAALRKRIKACRICVEQPLKTPLPHEPRPIFHISQTARVAICSQAPGTLAHASGKPFYDPSGIRLRAWLEMDEATFYDQSKVAIVPMGFCFPGQDAKGGDLPPRRECAPRWREAALSVLQELEVVLLVGSYAQRWHLGASAKPTLTETVRNWRQYAFANQGPRMFATPHPSWRNNAWLKANPWFERELLPELRSAVDMALTHTEN